MIAATLLAACRGQPHAIDLGAAAAQPVRIHDVVRRALLAAPRSPLELEVDVPRGARLRLACGIGEEAPPEASVTFVVKLRRRGVERTLATETLGRGPDAARRWIPLDVDLGGEPGPATLVLETRVPEGSVASGPAYWGTPVVVVPGRPTPLAIVYLVDTLRADHTTPYGYARDTTPELARLAADGVVFEAAISAASWTKPAVGSILTSQPPARHGAVQLRDALGASVTTLPEMLRAKGFTTGAVVANAVIYSAGTGFERGFDLYAGLHGAEDLPSDVVPAGPAVDAALRWLDGAGARPAFLYVHTMDPHVPYSPPPPFDRRYAPTPLPGRPAADPRFDYQVREDRDRLIAQYDGEIAYGDQELGRFLRELRARGLYDDALIVFMADHGEELLDHGQWLHGRSVYDEVVRVPLVVKLPRGRHAGRRVKQQVQTLDVLPTVLAEMGLPVPEAPVIEGRPLQAVLDGGAPERAAVSEISHRGNVSFGIRTANDKYVRRLAPEDDELYFDLAHDAGETVNRVAESADRARAQRSRLEAAMFPSPHAHHLQLAGTGVYALTLESNGFIEGLEATGFGVGERCTVDESRHRLTVEAHPRPGQPRSFQLTLRPLGAPVWVAGTKDGRPLDRMDVHIAQEDLAPAGVPFRLPEVEPQDASSRARKGRASRPPERGAPIDEDQAHLLAPPVGAPAGLAIWLSPRPGVKLIELDAATRERLRALGYLGH